MVQQKGYLRVTIPKRLINVLVLLTVFCTLSLLVQHRHCTLDTPHNFNQTFNAYKTVSAVRHQEAVLAKGRHYHNFKNCKLNTIPIMQSAVKIVSFNAQGLQLEKKRNKVFNWLKAKQANIYLLQETHSAPKDEATWQSKWGDKVWFSHGNTNSKGVAIAIQGSFGFKKIDTHSDTEGRYLILDAEINNIRGSCDLL